MRTRQESIDSPVLRPVAALMKAVIATLTLFLVVVTAVWLITAAEPQRLGTPVGCGVVDANLSVYDKCTPRSS
jgi:hypothetical protein